MMWVSRLWCQVSVERFGDVEYGGFGTPWEFVYEYTECKRMWFLIIFIFVKVEIFLWWKWEYER